MAFRRKPTSERDLSPGHDGNVESDIHEGDYRISLVPEKSDIPSSSASIIPHIDSPFLVATNAITWVLWSLYFWYEIGVVRHAQDIAGKNM